VGDVSGRDAVAILSQIRFVDRKRLAMKIATMDEEIFESLTKAVVRACFPNFYF
jgi:mRNA-degrading endonuclease toxin of MazEF toxin-antitoxin module